MNEDFLQEVERNTQELLNEMFREISITRHGILVVGCSSSEVVGQHIGTAGSMEVADVLLRTLQRFCLRRELYLAVQCCEHLNRALVVERQTAEQYRLEQVCVMPVRHAGGALAATAYSCFENPVVVESIAADYGIDIGSTLIGMHLKKVAVPLRLKQQHIGLAFVTAAKTRPKLIGGERAVYHTEQLAAANKE